MNSSIRILNVASGYSAKLGFRYILRHSSTVTGRKIGDITTNIQSKTIKVDFILNENKYLSDYFQKCFENMNVVPKIHKDNPIIQSIDKLNLLSNQKDDMDQIEYSECIRNQIQEINSQLKLMNQKEIAVLLNSFKDDIHYGIRTSRRLIDLELRWLLKSYLGTGLMDLDLSLYLAHIFHRGNIRSTYVGVLVNHLSHNLQPMTDQQLLYTLFLVMLTRKSSPILENYHHQIKEIIPKSSVQDLATICMAYFKTKTKITDSALISLIIDRTIELLPHMDLDEPGYCAIVKCIRYSQCHDNRLNVQQLIKSISSRPELLSSSYNIVHTLKLMETYRIYDDQILQTFFTNLMNNLDGFRIKDIQYILTSISNFAYNDLILTEDDASKLCSLCKQIANEERPDSYKQHLHALPLMRSLSFFNHYNNDLMEYIDKCLSNPKLFSEMSETFEFERNLLLMHSSTKLEANIEPFPSNRALLRKISNSMTRSGNIGIVKNDNSIQHLNFILNGKEKYLTISNQMREIALELASRPDLTDSHLTAFQHTFCHQNYGDLIISEGVNNPGNFSGRDLMPVAIPEGQKHYCVLALTKYDHIDGSTRLSGFKRLLGRLLSKIGYGVIYVNLDSYNLNEIIEKIKFKL